MESASSGTTGACSQFSDCEFPFSSSNEASARKRTLRLLPSFYRPFPFPIQLRNSESPLFRNLGTTLFLRFRNFSCVPLFSFFLNISFFSPSLRLSSFWRAGALSLERSSTVDGSGTGGLFRSRGGEEGSIAGLSRPVPNIPRQKRQKARKAAISAVGLGGD